MAYNDRPTISAIVWLLTLALQCAQMLGMMRAALRGGVGLGNVAGKVIPLALANSCKSMLADTAPAPQNRLPACLFSSNSSEADCPFYD